MHILQQELSFSISFQKACSHVVFKLLVYWAINPIVLDIKDFVSSFVYVRFSFFPNFKNEGAHLFAKLNYCLNQNFMLDWGRDSGGMDKWFVSPFFLVVVVLVLVS